MSTIVYIYLDGDSIGDRLELLLLDDRIEDAATFSKAVSTGIENLCENLLQIPGASLLFCGGDDLLAKAPEGQHLRGSIEAMRLQFLEETGCTISGGIGNTPKSAAGKLRRAKLLGKNRVL
jgi:GTP cyclohydrolase III